MRNKTFLINTTKNVKELSSRDFLDTTYIYIQQELFFVDMYPLSMQPLTYLLNMSHIFFCCHNIFFCDSHNFGVQGNFYVKFFFCWHNIVFCATRNCFLCNTYRIWAERISWIKRNRCVAIKKIWKRHVVLHLLAPFSNLRKIKWEYCLKAWEYSKNNTQTQFSVPEFL